MLLKSDMGGYVGTVSGGGCSNIGCDGIDTMNSPEKKTPELSETEVHTYFSLKNIGDVIEEKCV